ncbi:hypothetical protein [Sphingobacterium suaedae]|uniref:DUF3352 domain-containing protein n=1 Tax=Sphingobacterium suaedae TaxID=1686402 RepID=A0ABW5KIR3_9SPHI
MRNTIITSILLFVAVIGASIYYFANLEGDKKETVRPLTYLPKETFLIATFHNDATTDNIFKDFEIFEALIGRQEMEQWQLLKTKMLRNTVLQPYVEGVEIYASLHPEQDGISTLFTIPTLEHVEPEALAAIVDQTGKSYSVSQKDTLGARLFNFDNGVKDSIFHVLYHKNIFFVTYSDSLLYKILDEGVPKLDKSNIDYFVDNNSRNSPLSVYFVHDQVNAIAKHVLRRKPGKTLNLFENLGGKSAWNLNFKNDALILSGESETAGNKENYLEIFSHQNKTTQGLYQFFPENTASYLSFAVSDRNRFQQDLAQLFVLRKEHEQLNRQFNELQKDKGVSFDKQIVPLFGDEFAVVEQSNQTELAFLALRDTSGWKQLASNLVSEIEGSLYRFDYANIPYALFGDPLKLFSRPYFFRIGQTLVLANNQSVLQGYRRDWEQVNLLINTIGFKNFERIQGNEANVTYFLRTRTASNLISNLLKREYSIGFRDKADFGYQDFYSWSVQISGNSGKFLSSLYGIYKSKNALGASPEWTYEFENRPITAPWVFEHSDTSQFILIQEQDHTVHGIHPTGKKMWSAVLHGRIVGDAQQLADRSIVLVTDRNQLYRFDTEGNSISGFPVRMDGEPSHAPTIAEADGQQLIFVPLGRSISVYTLAGKRANGWEQKNVRGKILFDVKVRNNTIYVGTSEAHFYQFNATGELIKEEQLENSQFANPIALGSNSAKETVVHALDSAGYLVTIDFLQEPTKRKMDTWPTDAMVVFEPLGQEDARTAYIIDAKRLIQQGLQDSGTTYEFTFTQEITDRPQLFRNGGTGRLLGISSRGNNLIYLFDEKGGIYDGFPIEALPNFYFGKIDYNSATYLLCVRRDRKLYAFKN